jgi:molybdate transport system substrate-binding protein
MLAAIKQLIPEYERVSKDKVSVEFGPSMGTTNIAIPVRMARGEQIDVVILAKSTLEGLLKEGKVQAGTQVDMVESRMGLGMKEGHPHPDVSTVEKFRQAMVSAKSIAVSDSASGVYLTTKLFPQLGLGNEIGKKIRTIPADPVGDFLVRGEYEFGFQQVSELRAVKGVDVVSDLPEGVRLITIFSAGIPATAKQVEGAKAFIRWLASPAAAGAIRKTGLEPLGARVGGR